MSRRRFRFEPTEIDGIPADAYRAGWSEPRTRVYEGVTCHGVDAHDLVVARDHSCCRILTRHWYTVGHGEVDETEVSFEVRGAAVSTDNEELQRAVRRYFEPRVWDALCELLGRRLEAG